MSLLATCLWIALADPAAPSTDVHAPRFAGIESTDRILGTVVDDADRPVPRARVRAVAPPRTGYQGVMDGVEGAAPLEALTDEHGRFALEPLVRRARELTVHAEDGRVGYVAAVAAGEDVTVRVLPPATLTVELVDAATQRALGGVEVAAQWTEGAMVRQFANVPHRLARAVTDAEGRARLAGLAPGLMDIAYDLDGLASPLSNSARPWRALAGEDGTLRVKVGEPLRRLHGRVLDRGGHPLPFARVAISLAGEIAAQTGPDGRFELACFATDADRMLYVSAPGFALVARPLAELPEPLDLVLGPGRGVSGRFVTEDGAPVPHVAVAVVNDPFVALPDLVRGTSAEDGSFHLSGLRDDARHVLLASSPGHALLVRSLGENEFGAPELDLGTLALGPALEITGVFQDASGAPLSHALVSCSIMPPRHEGQTGPSTTQPQDMPIGSVRTDALGRFRFEGLCEGFATVTGVAQNTMRRESVTLQNGKPRVEVVVRAITPLRAPDPAQHEVGGSIRARVVLADGTTPAARTRVEIGPEDDTGTLLRETFTDERGEFSVSELHGARYRLSLELRDGLRESSPVRARLRASPEEFAALLRAGDGASPPVIRLRAVVLVKGRVVDPHAGEERPWLVNVTPEGPLGLPACVGSDDAGHFEFTMEEGALLTLRLTPLTRDPGVPRSARGVHDPAPFVVRGVRAGTDELRIEVP